MSVPHTHKKLVFIQGSRWHSPIEPMAQENKNWLKKNQIGNQTYEKYDFPNALRLHYNAVLYNADSACSSIMCVKMSAGDRGIHNASCENGTPCVFPSQVWHQLIFPEEVSTSHSIYNAYVIGDHV